MSFDVAKWNKQRYLAEAGLLESTADQAAEAINGALDSIDKNLSYKDFALAVAKILKEEYGSQNFDPFMEVLHAELGMKESLNEEEYKWKEQPKDRYSSTLRNKDMLNQVGRAVGDLTDLAIEKGQYQPYPEKGVSRTYTTRGIVGQLISDQFRGFVDRYENDLEGIKILDKAGYATYEPIWKDKEPESIVGPDPRGAGSLD
jgi:hypothetical protein